MISLDNRVGSKELESLFKPYGIKVLLTRLEFGDMSFIGNGPSGSCAVVVERKRITDLVQSITSHRLSGHQLPGMAEQYDYAYLVVEGLWRPGDNGELEIKNGQWSSKHSSGLNSRGINNYLSTLELMCGVIVRRTITPKETVAMVVDLYRYWTDKKWCEHKSHQAVYAPAEGGQGRRVSFMRREVSLVEKVALQLPGVGDKTAELIAKRFKSVDRMINATISDWTSIPGIGKTTAQRIIESLYGIS